MKKYAARDNYTVIATARDPSKMPKVETGNGSKVLVVTMDQAKSGGCLAVGIILLLVDPTELMLSRPPRRSRQRESPSWTSSVAFTSFGTRCTETPKVICSAATLLVEGYAPLREVDLGVFEEHWRVNVSSCLIHRPERNEDGVDHLHQVLGFLAFFQAMRPLIPKGGKFIFISSGSATIDQVPRGYEVTYGISKVR